MSNSTSKKLSQDIVAGDHITFIDEEGYLEVIDAGLSEDGYPALSVQIGGESRQRIAKLVFNRDVEITVLP